MSDETRSGPREVDVIVGSRIAARRMELGLTQSDLAAALGITFQQVQKYERGANRVSSSRLWMTAQFLGLPINAFFPVADADLEAEAAGPVAGPTARRIAREAGALSQTDQKLVVALLRRMGAQRPDDAT